MFGHSLQGSRIPASFVAIAILVLMLVAILVNAPHVLFGLADDNMDFRAHWRWAVEFSQDFRAGNLYPRWADNGNWGLGAPPMLFYSPLYFYLNAVFSFLVQDTWTTMRMVELLATFLVGWFALRLLSDFGVSFGLSMAGAVALQTAPMTFMIGNYFNGVPWATSFAATIALLYFFFRPRTRGEAPSVSIAASIALALLIMTHIMSGLMILIVFSGGVLLLGPLETRSWRVDWELMGRWTLTVVLALGMASVYLVPALTSLDLATTDNWENLYPPQANFVFSTMTWWRYGLHWLNFQWLMPSVMLPVILFSTVYYWRWRAEFDPPVARMVLSMLLVTWIALLLASEISFPLWLLPTPLLKVMYPWRFFYVLTASAMIAAVLCLALALPRSRRATIFVGVVSLLLPALYTAALSFYLIFSEGRVQQLDDVALEPYETIPEYHLPSERPGKQDYVANGGFLGHCTSLGVVCEKLPDTGHARRFHVRIPDGAGTRHLLLPVLDFPAWRLVEEHSGRQLPVIVDESTGLLTLDLPPGDHLVSVVWQRLPQEIVGALISLISLVMIVAIWIMQRCRRRINTATIPGRYFQF
jgi:uncharacterized membrane protein